MLSRRSALKSALAAPVLIAAGRLNSASAAVTLKISHQFPGGTLEEGDFRDRLCRRFAAELEKRTNGAITGQVYPNSSLMKTVAQFSALRKGALDVSLYPISYAGGEFPELNIGLMPGLVSSYPQGAAWKTSPIGQKFSAFLADKGVVILSWIWQAGGVASRGNPIVKPDDAKGQKIRGGSREMDMMLQAAGATTLSTPSNELYAAMQTGACDAAITSSTSLISFRLEEVAKSLTTGRGKSYWFMLEPLVMSKQIFDGLPKDQQDIIMALGAELEKFGTQGGDGRRPEGGRGLCQEGRQGRRSRRGHRREMARHRPRLPPGRITPTRTPLSAELLKLAGGRARILTALSRGDGARDSDDQRCRPKLSGRPVKDAGPAIGRVAYSRSRSRAHQPHRRVLSSIALVMAALVLTYSVRQPLLPASVDRLAGRALGVPDRRRRVHVGGRDPGAARPCRRSKRSSACCRPRINAVRQSLVDIASLTFCGYFAWKSWTLLDEAVDGELSLRLDLGAAAVDPLLAHVGRHDAAQPSIAAPGRRPSWRGGRGHDARCRSACFTARRRWS